LLVRNPHILRFLRPSLSGLLTFRQKFSGVKTIENNLHTIDYQHFPVPIALIQIDQNRQPAFRIFMQLIAIQLFQLVGSPIAVAPLTTGHPQPMYRLQPMGYQIGTGSTIPLNRMGSGGRTALAEPYILLRRSRTGHLAGATYHCDRFHFGSGTRLLCRSPRSATATSLIRHRL